MVLFHLCYDLKFISGVSLTWFEPPLQDIWRASISWTFLFVAGYMCAHSRSNLRRAGEYGAVAVAIWLVTTIAAVQTIQTGRRQRLIEFVGAMGLSIRAK